VITLQAGLDLIISGLAVGLVVGIFAAFTGVGR
jgi:flagellar biosynthesis protein FliQ